MTEPTMFFPFKIQLLKTTEVALLAAVTEFSNNCFLLASFYRKTVLQKNDCTEKRLHKTAITDNRATSIIFYGHYLKVTTPGANVINNYVCKCIAIETFTSVDNPILHNFFLCLSHYT